MLWFTLHFLLTFDTKCHLSSHLLIFFDNSHQYSSVVTIAIITFRLVLNKRDFHSGYIFDKEYKIRQRDKVYALLFLSAGSDFLMVKCNFSAIFNRADPFFKGLPFCIFVRNRIYVLNETRFQVVLMAGCHWFSFIYLKCYIIETKLCAAYHPNFRDG